MVLKQLDADQTRVTTADTRSPQAPKEASLVQIYGPNLGQRYVIEKPETNIGRDADCDIVLDSDNVSRAHARLLGDGKSVQLQDLGSTNGSLVNDREVKQHVLNNGDLIKIGSVVLKFISSGNAEALYHETIYRMTINDGLTGVANRRYFEDFLEREFARAIRYERPLSVALFDLDHFKKINDTYGHLAGDYVLRRVANTVLTTIRREELLARYGGEEFGIIMPERSLERAVRFGEKVRELIESTQFTFDTDVIEVTASVGVATLSDSVHSQQGLIKAADSALYRAKRRGRNQVCGAEKE